MREDVRRDASQVLGKPPLHLRFMLLLPLLEHIGCIDFRLTVHPLMMIGAKIDSDSREKLVLVEQVHHFLLDQLDWPQKCGRYHQSRHRQDVPVPCSARVFVHPGYAHLVSAKKGQDLQGTFRGPWSSWFSHVSPDVFLSCMRQPPATGDWFSWCADSRRTRKVRARIMSIVRRGKCFPDFPLPRDGLLGFEVSVDLLSSLSSRSLSWVRWSKLGGDVRLSLAPSSCSLK